MPNEENRTTQPSWASLFKENRTAANGMTLNFVAPDLIEGKPVARLETQEVEKNTVSWLNALIVYVVRETPTYSFMERDIRRNWDKVEMPELYYHEGGFFIVKFKSADDRDEILFLGPYTMNNKPVILRAWTSDFDFQDDSYAIYPYG